MKLSAFTNETNGYKKSVTIELTVIILNENISKLERGQLSYFDNEINETIRQAGFCFDNKRKKDSKNSDDRYYELENKFNDFVYKLEEKSEKLKELSNSPNEIDRIIFRDEKIREEVEKVYAKQEIKSNFALEK